MNCKHDLEPPNCLETMKTSSKMSIFQTSDRSTLFSSAEEASRSLLAPTFHSGTGTVVDLCSNTAENPISSNVDFDGVGLRRALVDRSRGLSPGQNIILFCSSTPFPTPSSTVGPSQVAQCPVSASGQHSERLYTTTTVFLAGQTEILLRHERLFFENAPLGRLKNRLRP